MNTELTNKKIELLKKIAKKNKNLEIFLDELLKFYGEDGVITNKELEEIIDSCKEKTNEIGDPVLKEELSNAIEEVKTATAENIDEVEAQVENELDLNEAIVEGLVEEEQVEETPTYDDSTKEKCDKLVQSCANSNVKAEIKPGDKAHYGYDTFSIEVSKVSQHILDSLKRLQVFAAYDITFEIVNGNYVMNVLNNGKGDINNVTSFENMINTITDYVEAADKTVDYLDNMKEEHALVQEKYENDHPMAKELYEKQGLSEDLTQYNDNAEDISELNNNNQESINPSSPSNNDDVTYTNNEDGTYTVNGANDNEITTGSEYYDETKTNKELSDEAPTKTNAPKTYVKTLGTYPGTTSHGFVTIATLVMGAGLTIGLIALFILMA